MRVLTWLACTLGKHDLLQAPQLEHGLEPRRVMLVSSSERQEDALQYAQLRVPQCAGRVRAVDASHRQICSSAVFIDMRD